MGAELEVAGRAVGGLPGEPRLSQHGGQAVRLLARRDIGERPVGIAERCGKPEAERIGQRTADLGLCARGIPAAIAREHRSEEHTSELQSLMRISYAVFCLKKKKKNTPIIHLSNECHTRKQKMKNHRIDPMQT